MKFFLTIAIFASILFSQSKAPAFYLPILGGGDFFASEQYGAKAKNPKVTVISFTASWCAPCQKEIKALDSLMVKYPNISFYLVDYKEELQTVENWNNRLQTDIPILLDFFGLTAKKFQVESSSENEGKLSVVLPRLFVINKEGSIVYSHKGYKDSDALLLEKTLFEYSGNEK